MFDKTLNIDISGKSIRKKKGYPADTSTPLALSLLGHSRYVRHDLKYRLYPANLSGLTLPDIRPNQLIVPDCTVFAGGNPDYVRHDLHYTKKISGFDRISGCINVLNTLSPVIYLYWGQPR